MMFEVFYRSNIRSAMAGIMKVARKALKTVHAAECKNDVVQTGEGVEGTRNSERKATVALRLPSAHMLYLAERKEYF